MSASLHSAGIVVYRQGEGGPEVLLVHPGGPFWANKDANAWSIPKGEFDPATEDAEEAAKREFGEELGHPLPPGPLRALPSFKAGRKTIVSWLVEGDLDPATVSSNTFEMEWPPKSGKTEAFPEVDEAAWFPLADVEKKLHKGQAPLGQFIRDFLAEPS